MINANRQFEIIGDLYERRYHRLRPGKSVSPLAGYHSMDEDNVNQFNAWREAQAFWDAVERIAELEDEVKAKYDLIETSTAAILKALE